MKASLIVLVISIGAVILLGKFLGEAEVRKIKDLKSKPVKYAFFQHSTWASISLVSREKECLKSIMELL